MVSTVDSSVKNVTDALKIAGLWNNTLLFWATDNGKSLLHSRIASCMFLTHMYLQGLRSPKEGLTTRCAAGRPVGSPPSTALSFITNRSLQLTGRGA